MTLKFLRTNRIRRIVIIKLILFALYPFYCNSQNLYNLENSLRYAEYLSSSHQYTLAAEEYERLIFLDENNITFKYKLINSYRLSGNLTAGINRLYSFYGNDLYSMPGGLATEFMRLQLLKDSLLVADEFIQRNNTLSSEDKAIFQCCQLLLSGKYSEAGLYLKRTASNNLIFPTSIVKLTEKAGQTKFKSPFMAAGFSAIIPGTGKFYTNNWSDGLFSMLFIASTAWQAYRGFSEYGTKSAYGWTFAGLSVSFYIGNIFGGAKAARRYNTMKRNEIENQIYDYIRSDSF